MPSVEKILAEMRNNPKGIRFEEALKVAEYYFGAPRIVGSHYVFKNIWSSDPRIVLQRQGAKAKPYQVKQLLKSIDEKRYLQGDEHHV